MYPGALALVDVDRRARLERSLALARTALGLLALVLVLIDLPAQGYVAPFTGDLLIAFNVYALLVAVLVGMVRPIPALGALLHICDILWAVWITSGVEAIGSTSSIFFLFVLVSAAHRWGLAETILTALATGGLEFMHLTLSTPSGVAATPVLRGQLITRPAYFIALAWLMGYLADQQNRSRTHTAATMRILGGVDVAVGLRASVQRVLQELLQSCAARRALILFQERSTGRVYRWSMSTADATVQMHELPASERDDWIFPAPSSARAWRLRRHGSRVTSVSDMLGRRRRTRRALPASARLPFDRWALMGILHGGDEWTGRLLIVDPARPDGQTVDWFATLTIQLGPALYSLYLLRRLRTRVSMVERTRLARELHDGLIQTLVGVEMQVEVLRRRSATGQPIEEADVARIQAQLHDEVVNARELMQQVKPVEFNPRDLPGRLAELCERFRRDTGIDVQFVCTLEEPELTPRLAGELLRIAQEALVNVRKHSGASHVLVRFAGSRSHWALVVDDNGRGLDFSGSRTLDELDRTRRGPVVIKERVRGVGGSLVLDSLPGRGTCLEISVPRT